MFFAFGEIRGAVDSNFADIILKFGSEWQQYKHKNDKDMTVLTHQNKHTTVFAAKAILS